MMARLSDCAAVGPPDDRLEQGPFTSFARRRLVPTVVVGAAIMIAAVALAADEDERIITGHYHVETGVASAPVDSLAPPGQGGAGSERVTLNSGAVELVECRTLGSGEVKAVLDLQNSSGELSTIVAHVSVETPSGRQLAALGVVETAIEPGRRVASEVTTARPVSVNQLRVSCRLTSAERIPVVLPGNG